MSYLRLAVVLGLCAAVGCTELDPLVRGSCGNGVIEPEFGEDCDGATDALCGAADDPLRACRRLCDPAATPSCASGAACGDDGVCHQASGGFVAVSERSWTATDTLLIDSNGDGAPDLVGVSNQRVDLALGTGDGAFAATTAFPGQYVTGAPAVGDPTGDGLPDVLIPTPLGVLTMAGDPFDGLAPVTQNSFPVQESGRMLFGEGPVGDGAALVQAFRTQPGASVLMIDRDPPDEAQFLPFPAGLDIDDVIGTELAIVPLFGESVLVAAFPDGVWLVGLRPTADGTAVAMTSYGLVALDPGSGQVQQAFAAELNADLFPDLVIVTSTATEERVQVLRGTAISVFQTFRGFGTGRATTIWNGPAIGPDAIGPLAMRDAVEVPLEGDVANQLETAYVSVLVARRSVQLVVCFADGSPACAMAELRRGFRDWTDAAVADVNADGAPDLIGWNADEPNVDVMLATELGLGLFLYNDAVLATPGPMRGLELGDFDGDGVTDTVVVVGRRASGDGDIPTDHELHVAFGARGAAPVPPVLAAKLGAVAGLIAINVPFAFRRDALDDLLVVSDRGANGGAPARGAAFLFGSTSRRLIAPLLLSTAEDFTTPVALAAMHLDDRAGEDLVVLGRDSVSFRVLPYSPNGFTMEPLGDGITVPVATVGRPDRSLWTTVARTGAVRIGAAADIVTGKTIALEFPCSPCQGDPPTIKGLTAPVILPPASSLRAGDIDGDGDQDLIGVYDDPAGGNVAGARAAQVVLWTNAGGLTPAATHVFTIDDVVHDAVAADLDLDGVPELVFAARQSVLVARQVGGTWQAPTALYPRADGAAPAVYIEAIDLTGDGLLDLAVAAGSDRRHPSTLEVLAHVETRSAFVEGASR